MPQRQTVSGHYTHGGLEAAIREGINRLGKSIDEITLDDLAAVDEFHIGGRVATESFLDQLDIDDSHHVLDVGCGLGGTGRYAAHRYGCRVTGIDLTPEFVETGNLLCEWLGLCPQVELAVHDATELPHSDESFDRAFMLHVGMNIADKESLCKELHRVVRDGGKVGIYDVMQIQEGELEYPVPWATSSAGSAVSTVLTYRAALEDAGFRIVAERDRKGFSLEFFDMLQKKVAAAGGPPPLGLHILMGDSAATKVKNMLENIRQDRVAPVELIAVKEVV